MFTKAIVRIPSKSMVDGITTANLGKPDYEKALKQHKAYIAALQKCGLEVIVLETNEAYPDSTFVEDVALLTPKCAIITRPGAETRKGEIADIRAILEPFYENIETITAPGTVEAGDIMMVGSHFYIGLSARTNAEGAQQMIVFLEKYGLSGSVVKLEKVLHLKTGLAYLEQNNLVASGEFLAKPEFKQYNILEIAPSERAAANCIWVNGTVIMPKGFAGALATIKAAGYPTIALDMSEYQKLDGGLSCLSLRF